MATVLPSVGRYLDTMPRVRLLLFALAVLVLLRAAPAGALADHEGWPPYNTGSPDTMLLMNKRDGNRPLDARPGFDPFGGQDPLYRCDSIGLHSPSCFLRFVPLVNGLTLEALDPRTALEHGLSLVMTDRVGHARLLGGHGDDTIHAAPWGDVIWGDYKPTQQTKRQTDRLYGGAGPDFIYPSHGRNVVKAGAGTDIVHGRYGHGTIDCGPGRDALYLPAVDGAYKIKNCEWKRKKTGDSAPKWALRKLPWYKK